MPLLTLDFLIATYLAICSDTTNFSWKAYRAVIAYTQSIQKQPCVHCTFYPKCIVLISAYRQRIAKSHFHHRPKHLSLQYAGVTPVLYLYNSLFLKFHSQRRRLLLNQKDDLVCRELSALSAGLIRASSLYGRLWVRFRKVLSLISRGTMLQINWLQPAWERQSSPFSSVIWQDFPKVRFTSQGSWLICTRVRLEIPETLTWYNILTSLHFAKNSPRILGSRGHNRNRVSCVTTRQAIFFMWTLKTLTLHSLES